MIALYLLAASMSPDAPPTLLPRPEPPLATPAPAAPPPARQAKARKTKPPKTRARANLAQYVSDADYPPAAIRAEQQGTVGFRLEVSSEGYVTACEIVESSGSPALDEATCGIMTGRARFEPARDRKGQAVPDTVTSRMRWVLPEEGDSPDDGPTDAASPPPPPAPPAPPSPGRITMANYISDADYPPEALARHEEGTVAFRLQVTPQGRVGACTITQSSGSSALDGATCRILTARARFTPARDSSGNPVADSLDQRIRWVLPANGRTVREEKVLLPESAGTREEILARTIPPTPPGIRPPTAKANLASYIEDQDYPRDAVARHEQGRVWFRLAITPDGRARSCFVTRSSGSNSLDQGTCRVMLLRARFNPARNSSGEAVAGSLDSSIGWVLPN